MRKTGALYLPRSVRKSYQAFNGLNVEKAYNPRLPSYCGVYRIFLPLFAPSLQKPQIDHNFTKC